MQDYFKILNIQIFYFNNVYVCGALYFRVYDAIYFNVLFVNFIQKISPTAKILEILYQG